MTVPYLNVDYALSDNTIIDLTDEKFLFKTTSELTDKLNYWFENREELNQSKTEYLEMSKQYKIEDSYKKLVQTYYTALEMHAEKIPNFAEQLQLS